MSLKHTLCLLLALAATQPLFSPTPMGHIALSGARAATWQHAGSTKLDGSAPGLPDASAAALSTAPDDYTTQSLQAQEVKMLNLLNQDRKSAGLPPLTLDPELSRIARLKSQDMLSNGYFAHESPTWGKAKAMLTALNYSFRACGENIARHATVEKAQAALITSEGHRRNILSRNWEKVGIGIALDKNGYVYATQLFVR